MSDKFTSDLLCVVIAQIAQTIGYSRTQKAPLELLEDILQRFIQQLARDLHSQAEHACRIEPNLRDVLLSLKNLNINVQELLDYIGNVEPIPFVREVPAYPVKRHSNMNFLKPGSAETLTRPVHIFEYLPPMLPPESNTCQWLDKSDQDLQLCKLESTQEATRVVSPKNTAKLLLDVKIDYANTGIPKWNGKNDGVSLASLPTENFDDGHTVREINSVVMTTGGFISPAIEGKLPDPHVPKIIEKFKGLDAPSISLAHITLDTKKQSPDDSGEILVTNPSEAGVQTSNEIPTSSDRSLHIEENNDNTITKICGQSVLSTPNIKQKKNKNKIAMSDRLNDEKLNSSAIKAQDKAHRKAIKMYQKSSKSQNESGNNIGELKKIKNVNRGLLPTLAVGSADRIQLEKLIKKQSKQRQKHLKTQKQQRQFKKSALSSMAVPQCYRSVPEPSQLSFSHPIAGTMTENSPRLVDSLGPEKKNVNTSDLALSFKEAPCNVVSKIPDEIKLASEPDQNKLNIFKKISKQKASKPISPNNLNIGINIFENHNNVSPLINLPCGTTITPAPSLISNEISTMPIYNNSTSANIVTPYDTVHSYDQLPAGLKATTNSTAIEENKPKKRGRKPGGKNQGKPQTSTASSPIPHTQASKKHKSTKPNPLVSMITDSPLTKSYTMSSTVAISMEPLNLSQTDQLKVPNNPNFMDNVIGGNFTGDGGSTVSGTKYQKSKDKKDKKKNKTKFTSIAVDDVHALDKQISTNLSVQAEFLVGESSQNNEVNLQKPPEKLSEIKNAEPNPSPSVGNNLGLISAPGSSNFPNINDLASNQPNIMPMMSLLPYPPRPGLIPSGPSLFPSSLSSFNKTMACSTGSNMLLPHSFMNFSTTGRSTAITHKSSNADIAENKSVLPGTLPLSDINLERSYCNVAPLVPDSMKLGTPQNESMPLKSPHANAINIENVGKKINQSDVSISSIISQVAQTGTIGIDEVLPDKTTQASRTMKISPAGTGMLGDPIEVSDDSNDHDSSKQLSSFSNCSTSSLIQGANLPNAEIHQFNENSHSYSLNVNRLPHVKSDSKQQNKQFQSGLLTFSKMDSNVLSLNSSIQPSSFNINFMGNDKFSLAGGADLIPLSRIDSGLAYSSIAVPSTSLAAGATSGALPIPATSDVADQQFISSIKFDDVTITPTNNLNINEFKIRKLHKKLKKPKEGKIKRKKDKKDKIKFKEAYEEKYVVSTQKPKSQEKKLRKEKKRERHVIPDNLQIGKDTSETEVLQTKNNFSGPIGFSMDDALPPTVSENIHQVVSPKTDLSPNQVPKLTLKLSGRSTPIQSSLECDHDASLTDIKSQNSSLTKRGHSPELARFSPLVTRPPKPKQCDTQPTTSPSSSLLNKPHANPIITPMLSTQFPTSTSWASNASTSTISASSVLLPQQLVHPSKEILKPEALSTSISLPIDVATVSQRNTEEELAEINRPSSYVDADGYRIWICPACGKVDDGSAMIGCDGCDAWYHWICVGISVAPNDNEDWFCRVCVTKKKVSGSERKKKRNKKK